jgi:hypothetical protein
MIHLHGLSTTKPEVFAGKKRLTWGMAQGVFKRPVRAADIVIGQEIEVPARGPSEYIIQGIATVIAHVRGVVLVLGLVLVLVLVLVAVWMSSGCACLCGWLVLCSQCTQKPHKKKPKQTTNQQPTNHNTPVVLQDVRGGRARRPPSFLEPRFSGVPAHQRRQAGRGAAGFVRG